MSDPAVEEAGLEVEDVLVAAPAQQGGVFHSLLDSSESMYVCHIGYDIHGPLDVDAFVAAWRVVFSRHEALRSAFEWEGLEHVVQVVYAEVPLPLTVEDWRTAPEADRQARFAALEEEERRRGFALGAPPLVRLRLVRLGEGHVFLSFAFHHILLDGWSLQILHHDFLAAYRALAAGEMPELPAPPPYRDFVEWLTSRDPAPDERYWTEYLAGGPPHGRLTVGRKAQVVGYHPRRRSAQVGATLPASLARRIGERCREERITLATLASLVWGLVLARYADEADVVFGLTVAYRPADVPRVTEMVGPFFNTVPVRVRVAPERTIRTALAALHEALTLQRDHVQLSPSTIQRLSGSPAGRPLFETAVRVQTGPRIELEGLADTLSVTTRSFVDVWHYPVCFIVEPIGDRLELRLDHDPDAFTHAEMQRLLGHVEALFATLTEDLDRRLETVELLTAAERQRQLVDWNRTPPIEPVQSIVELIERKARATPDALVAIAGPTEIRIREINGRANQLARALVARGIGLEGIVALDAQLQAQLAVYVALGIAIWKAGGGLWALDPRSSPERLATAAAACSVALHVRASTGDPILPGVPQVTLEVLLAEAALLASDDLPLRARANATAALILTSGSTGVPNLVAITSRAAATLQQSYLLTGALKPGHRTYSPNAGGSLSSAMISDVVAVLASPSLPNDPEAFYAFLERERIDGIHITPGQLALLDPSRTPRLERILVGTEYLPPATVRRWLGHTPLHQYYRSTEGSPGVRGVAGPEYLDEPHVGTPSAGGQVYLLDSGLRPVPVGVVGEVFIGGDALARGYVGRADLTAARFLPDPYGVEAGARMYRMGDLGRWYADGRLEFLGRRDRQVKVRGFRVELEEIESRVVSHRAVQRAAVIQTMHPTGEPVLVAYLEARAGEVLDVEVLRAALRAELPEHMVPPFFVVLDALPTAGDGRVFKILRRLLPAPDWSKLRAPQTESASTPTERGLAAIWAELLASDEPGVDDDFFALGGHSLLVPRLVSAIQEKLGRRIELRAVFDAPTLRAMAQRVDATPIGASPLAPLPPVVRNAWAGDLPISPNQGRGLFMLETGVVEAQLTAVLRVHGPLDAEALAAAVHAIYERHDVLRAVFTRAGEGWRHHLDAAWRTPFDIVEQRGLGPDEQAQALRADMAAIVLAPGGPLSRVRLFRYSDVDAALVITMAHVLSDAGSRQVLARELGAFYRHFAHGEPLALAPLPFQYADFARWVLDLEQLERGQQEIAYWRTYLAGATPFALPREETGAAADAPNEVATGRLVLDRSVREALVSMHSSPFLHVLSSLAIALHAASGLQEIVVNSSHHNRHVEGTEQLIGFFVAPLYLRVPVTAEMRYAEVLAALKEAVYRGREHGNIDIPKFVSHALSLSFALNLMYVSDATTSQALDEQVTVSLSGREHALQSRRELTFSAFELGDVVTFEVNYKPQRYVASHMRELRDRWLQVAERALRRADLTIRELLE